MQLINTFFLISFIMQTSLLAMDGYKKEKYKIVNPLQFSTNKKTSLGYSVGITCEGKYLVSNYHNSTILTCFAGNFTEDKEDIKWPEKPSILAYNPLSLLNVKTGINKPFQPIPELDNTTPVSALHILDDNTYAIGHNKNIYLLQENNSLFKIKPALKVIHTITSLLSHDNNDKVHNIDSSSSHMIAISTKGNITVWQKNENIINTTTNKTTQCSEPFFSAIFNQKENLLCLGLDNGKLFIADITNLSSSRIITIFPLSTLKIDSLHSYDDNILACSFEMYKKEHGYNNSENPFCCTKNWGIDPTCQECKKINYETIYNQNLTCHGTEIEALKNKLEADLKKLNEKECEHVTAKKKQRPEICNYHKPVYTPFAIDNALLSAQELKSMLNNNNSILKPLSILNEELLTKSLKEDSDYGRFRDKQILNIQLISHNNLLIHVAHTKQDQYHPHSQRRSINKIYLGTIHLPVTYTNILCHYCEYYEPKKHDHKDTWTQLHIIPTEENSVRILQKQTRDHNHLVINKIISFANLTSNPITDFTKNDNNDLSNITPESNSSKNEPETLSPGTKSKNINNSFYNTLYYWLSPTLFRTSQIITYGLALGLLCSVIIHLISH